MKNLFFYLLFIIPLGLASCITVKGITNNIDMNHNDYLVYRLEDSAGKQQLILYDPISKTQTQILPDWTIDEFSLSSKNRFAFVSSHDGNSNIYILDFPFTDNTPKEITFDASAKITPISWSPNGRYLLFCSVLAENKKLSLWDGKNFSDIYIYHGEIGETAWSANGQLAFTEFFINAPLPYKDPSEVYLWDGKSTRSVSQNPFGEDRYPAWSKDGQLAFLSEQNGDYDIFVWDGVLKINGLPDKKTYKNISPGLFQYFSDLTWTNSDLLAFSASSKSDSHVQIYEWDGQTARNISKNPLFHNGGQTWRDDGYWSFITFFSESQYLYIRDDSNQTLLQTKGQYSPAWSQNGLLLFCAPNSSHDWTLSIWTGNNIVEVITGGFIYAKWNNGKYVFCSSG
jgi:Tol biopolymer transport system component